MRETVSSVDRKMTATEVAAREAEKVMTFSSSFVQFVSDFRVMMYRVLCLMLRAGLLPLPPEGIVEFDRTGTRWQVKRLNVRYMGKIAQAVARSRQEGLGHSLENLSRAAELLGPQVLDIIDPDRISAEIWDEGGAPLSVRATPEEILIKRQLRMAALNLEEHETAA